jgi:hypothetical protein
VVFVPEGIIETGEVADVAVPDVVFTVRESDFSAVVSVTEISVCVVAAFVNVNTTELSSDEVIVFSGSLFLLRDTTPVSDTGIIMAQAQTILGNALFSGFFFAIYAFRTRMTA